VTQKILALDVAGTPRKWIEMEAAVHYYVKDMVAWAIGETDFTYHGGIARSTGERSLIVANSIIAVRGPEFKLRNPNHVPQISKDALLARDRHICAYCGGRFKRSELDCEHVVPLSKGGRNNWMNLVTACKRCNHHKRNRTPEEAHMPLIYLPYVPNRHEHFILSNRNILADQMQYLMASVPKSSRLHG
jgi:HNH endonuclease